MEQNKPATSPITLASALTIGLGAFNFITSAIGLIGAAIVEGAVAGGLSSIALIGVLAGVGALQIVCGTVGIKCVKNNKLRSAATRLGLVMLLATVVYTVVTAILRGFQWSTVLSMAVSVMYLTFVRPNSKTKEPQKIDEAQ